MIASEQGRAQLQKLSLAPWASRRRQELLELLDRMNPTIEELTAAVEREARKRPEVMRLMTHPGVGPLTALAYVLIIGTPTRFQRGKQIGNYVGMIPSEDSSAGKQRLGHISKQGNSLLRFLLVEAAQAAARNHPDWRRRYMHLVTSPNQAARTCADQNLHNYIRGVTDHTKRTCSSLVRGLGAKA
jgi:transposase